METKTFQVQVLGWILGIGVFGFLTANAQAQTREQLIAGAFTDVPASANSGYVSLAVDCPRCPPGTTHDQALQQQCMTCTVNSQNTPDFDERIKLVNECIEERINACHAPLHVMSAITGVEFHTDQISSSKGGLSSTAQPKLKKANGVDYWFISGELSGYFTDEFGTHIAVGPIDLKGLSHRGEVFDPCNPNETCTPNAHPRAGLPGAFFGLSIPVHGFNGGLVQIEAAGDGGSDWPAAPLLFNPVDPITLLERGYAVFTFGQGGTVRGSVPPECLCPNGWGGEDNPGCICRDEAGEIVTLPEYCSKPVIDTNPNSGSGIFWTAPTNIDGDHMLCSHELVSYTRPAFFNEQTGEETALPSDFTVPAIDPDPCCSDEIFNIPFGVPEFFFGSIHTYPEIISDTVIFAKNLMRALSRKSPASWASYVGWSGSGRAAVMIDSNVRGGGFQVFSSTGPQMGGGDYNIWGNPASGLRYDAFVSYAGANDSQGYMTQGFFQNDVNPSFPISAPFVWLVPEGDVTLPQSAAYIYANKVWRALDALGRGAEVNNFIRVYALPKATHQARDQLFSAFDSQDSEGGLWYDYADLLPNPGAFNTQRRGLRVSDPYAQALPFNGPLDGWDFFFHGKAGVPRDTPLWLQLFADLREFSKRGVQLPVSRVHAELFDHIDEVSTETVLPTYPVVNFTFPEMEEEFLAEIFSIEHSISEDTGIAFTEEEGNTIPRPLTSEEVGELKAFAHENPLERSTQPLLLPDAAVPLGTNFYFFDLAFQAPFTQEELRARYKNHGGYIRAFAEASNALLRNRLWDARLGATYIGLAGSSDVLAPSSASKGKPAAKKASAKVNAPQKHFWPPFRETERRRPGNWQGFGHGWD